MKEASKRNTGVWARLGVSAALLSAGVLCSQGTLASEDQAQHLADCKVELHALYGDKARLRMIKAKSYRGMHTMKFKVYPEGQSLTIVECVSDDTAEQGIVVMSKEGDVLTS